MCMAQMGNLVRSGSSAGSSSNAAKSSAGKIAAEKKAGDEYGDKNQKSAGAIAGKQTDGKFGTDQKKTTLLAPKTPIEGKPYIDEMNRPRNKSLLGG